MWKWLFVYVEENLTDWAKDPTNVKVIDRLVGSWVF